MKIPVHKIENYTASCLMDVKTVPDIKRANYFVDDTVSVDGDAPKKFIGVYDHELSGDRHKANRKNWIRYIAKTGHKWYPIESVTELMLNRLGTIFGLNMAESRIAMIGGQLRFLSRYFLHTGKDELVHGADILAADNNAAFNINLGKLFVGTLLYSDGIWHFSYSNEFKAQDRILPLANFPSKDKEYSSRELWPFFTSRIPSNAQLQIEKDKPRENIVSLLQKFGRRTVANPYELCPVL